MLVGKRHQQQQSLSHKVFVRTSKKGNVSKIVREQYLRTDIPCSAESCSVCYQNLPPNADGSVLQPILSATPHRSKKRGPHYVVIDTNIALKSVDLLEHAGAFYDVIVPQIVLEEVRNRSIPVYNRIRNLTSGGSSGSVEKRFYVFHNEFRQETHIDRIKGESVNDLNDRAIRKVCQWYNKHLQESLPKSKSTVIPEVVLVTEDRANRDLATAEGIPVVSLRNYLLEFPGGEDLVDLIPADQHVSVDLSSKTNKSFYDSYYAMSRLLGGIKNGTLHQGKISINQYNFLEATVSTSAYPKPILVLGRENINRACHGDVVVIELLPRSQWQHHCTRIIEEEVVDKTTGAEEEQLDESLVTEDERRALAEDALAAQKLPQSTQPTAKVVGVMKRDWRFYVGHIDPKSTNLDNSNSQRSVFVIPMDKCIPRIRIKTRKAKSLFGKRIVVAIDDWPVDSRNPEGHFVRDLGEIESKQAETESLLLEYDVEYRPFPKTVLSCLPAEGHDWKVPEDAQSSGDPLFNKRKDLRDLLICSIDPPNCQDIDDALHAYELPNGNFHVGVHIADVTHFVKPATPLDDEGASRGTSVYLVDKRIDMLPMLLGTDLCSLKPYVDRYAFSVLWEITPDAQIVNTSFTKSIIRSREAFSYEQAQLRIDDQSKTDDLTNGIRILLKLSKLLKQARLDAGALNLASPEVKVHMDSETSDPGDVEIKALLETNSLVEEFMLLANISVAEKIYDAFPQTAMLRRHGAPPATNFEVLNDQLRVKKGMHLELESSKTLADSLDTCVDASEPFFNTLVRIMATRCMLAAQYFSSGSYAYPEFRHYGLASEIYTHFTSPIRRYADVVAHRQLAAAIDYEPLHPSHRDKAKMERICDNINKRHRNAQFAGRASIEYYVGQVLKSEDSEQEGYVCKVYANGIVILVPRFGVESLVRIENMTSLPDSAELNEETYTLSFDTKSGRKEISVFDKLNVYIESVKEESTGKRKVQMTLRDL